MKKKNTKQSGNDRILLYGKHPCIAALKNPSRKCYRLFITKNALKDLPKDIKTPKIEVMEAKDITQKLFQNTDVTHQGIALETSPLSEKNLKSVLGKSPIIILDQITDPNNVGAILRSAAAFEAAAIITPKNHSHLETPALAKTASGTLEITPLIKVSNLARSIEELKSNGYWCAGMDGTARTNIEEIKSYEKIVIIMGAEGKGLRKLTKESCDILVKLPISKRVESLNVSNAAAIALYELYK